MRFMVLLKADKTTEAGVLPSEKQLAEMGKYNERLADAGVLLGSPLRLGDKPAAQELWDSTVSKLTDPIDPGFVRGFIESTFTRPVSEAFLESMVQESLKVPAFVWKATIAGLLQDDFTEELGRITAPTLVIWGDHDTILPRSEQEALAAGISGARLVVYPGAGHVFYWEDPARVAVDVAAFVGQASV